MKQTNDNVKTFSSSEARKILIAMRQGRWRDTIGLLEPLAESGNSEAMYWMGERLQVAMRILNPDASSKRKYIMIRADKEKAWMWMERSAEKDYPKALFWLGYQYYTGRLGCEKNEEKAFTYFERAAQLGNIPATYYLSQCYQYARVPASTTTRVSASASKRPSWAIRKQNMNCRVCILQAAMWRTAPSVPFLPIRRKPLSGVRNLQTMAMSWPSTNLASITSTAPVWRKTSKKRLSGCARLPTGIWSTPKNCWIPSSLFPFIDTPHRSSLH